MASNAGQRARTQGQRRNGARLVRAAVPTVVASKIERGSAAEESIVAVDLDQTVENKLREVRLQSGICASRFRGIERGDWRAVSSTTS